MIYDLIEYLVSYYVSIKHELEVDTKEEAQRLVDGISGNYIDSEELTGFKVGDVNWGLPSWEEIEVDLKQTNINQ